MSEWQPIETAPKDVWILLYEEGLIWPGGFESEESRWHCPHPDFDGNPTHWMPLPSPPTGA